MRSVRYPNTKRRRRSSSPVAVEGELLRGFDPSRLFDGNVIEEYDVIENHVRLLNAITLNLLITYSLILRIEIAKFVFQI